MTAWSCPIGECLNMSYREIGDMDVVALASSIGSGVVRTKYLEGRSFSHGRINCEGTRCVSGL